MANFLYEIHLQGIMVVVVKVINTTLISEFVSALSETTTT